MANEFNVEEFLDNLNNDKSKSKSSTDRIKKIYMDRKDNFGTICLLLFFDAKTNSPYVKVRNVREVYGYNGKIDNDTWHRILEKTYYGDLSIEDSTLYDEVSGLFQTLADTPNVNYRTARKRNYSLVYGVLLDQYDTADVPKFDGKEVPALMIFPSTSFIDALGDSISQKKISNKGSIAFIPMLLNNNNTGRSGILVIKHSLPESGGYKTTVSFEFNSPANIVVDESKVYGEEFTGKFKDSVNDFLGFQGGSTSYFNREYFLTVKELLIRLIAEQNRTSSEVKTPPINQNVADPMVTKPGFDINKPPLPPLVPGTGDRPYFEEPTN